MKKWKNLIPGAFGIVDKKFAGHPLDVQRARKLLVAAIGVGASYADYTTAIRQWLVAQGCSSACCECANEKGAKRRILLSFLMIMIDIPRMAFGFCIPNHTAAMICAVLPLCWLGGERSGSLDIKWCQ